MHHLAQSLLDYQTNQERKVHATEATAQKTKVTQTSTHAQVKLKKLRLQHKQIMCPLIDVESVRYISVAEARWWCLKTS